MKTLTVTEKLKAAKGTCLKHADDLLEASEILIGKRKFNLAHHLAILGLEEVGKFELYRKSLLPTKEDSTSILEKWGDNHKRKLFWALWTPTLKDMTPVHFTETQRLSQDLHEQRLDGLYTGADKEGIRPPKAISLDACKATLSYAKSRINHLRNLEFLEMTDEERELTSWFLEATEDELKSPYIFNKNSMAKLKEIGEVRKWVNWIRQKITEDEAEAAELLQSEIARAKEGSVSGKNRWRIKIRLYTNTNSVRPKALTWWNENIVAIKLYPVAKFKDRVDVHILLSDRATAQNLYQVGDMFFTRIILALNLGCMGFFSRALPYDQDRYFDEIDDLDHPRMRLNIANPKLLLNDENDRTQKRALEQSDLERVANCLAYIARIKTAEEFEPFAAYRSGINLLSHTNIHCDFRLAAFQEFHRAFKKAAILFGSIKNGKEFAEFFKLHTQKGYADGLNTDHFMRLVQALDRGVEKIFFSTDDLWTYKVLLEGFLVSNMKRITNDEIRKARTNILKKKPHSKV